MDDIEESIEYEKAQKMADSDNEDEQVLSTTIRMGDRK